MDFQLREQGTIMERRKTCGPGFDKECLRTFRSHPHYYLTSLSHFPNIFLSQHHPMLTTLPPAAALHYRTVRIYTPTKTTMQSGKQGNGHWRIDFDTLEGGGRWENPLMGWGSS
jgi:hypothetical protein